MIPVVTHSDIEIVTFDVLDNYIVCGGLEGELYMNHVSGIVIIHERLADDNSTKITNHVEMYKDGSRIKLLTCNNDNKARIIDPDNYRAHMTFRFNQCVNHGAFSPDHKMLGVCLDSRESFISDVNTGSI